MCPQFFSKEPAKKPEPISTIVPQIQMYTVHSMKMEILASRTTKIWQEIWHGVPENVM